MLSLSLEREKTLGLPLASLGGGRTEKSLAFGSENIQRRCVLIPWFRTGPLLRNLVFGGGDFAVWRWSFWLAVVVVGRSPWDRLLLFLDGCVFFPAIVLFHESAPWNCRTAVWFGAADDDLGSSISNLSRFWIQIWDPGAGGMAVTLASWIISLSVSMVVFWTAVVLAAMVGSASAATTSLVSALVLKSVVMSGLVSSFAMSATTVVWLIRVYSLGFPWSGLVGFGLFFRPIRVNYVYWASIRWCWLNWVFMNLVKNFF